MRIAVFGASGSVGTTLLAQLLKGSLLNPGDEIILMSRGSAASVSRLAAIRADLMDAFHEKAVNITVCRSLRELRTDILIMSAGATFSDRCRTRQELALPNRDLFGEIARGVAASNPNAFVFIISNPVELAVAIFAQHMSRLRVVGIGAQHDTLRFERAIAERLGINRADVNASVLGEHGDFMVPLWSSIKITPGDKNHLNKLAIMRVENMEKGNSDAIAAARQLVSTISEGDTLESAYDSLSLLDPSVRIQVEPSMTASQLHSTPNSTANATLDCLDALLSGNNRKVHCQVFLEGECYGIYGVCGVPVHLHSEGWQRAVDCDHLSKEEDAQLQLASRAINLSIQSALEQGTTQTTLP